MVSRPPEFEALIARVAGALKDQRIAFMLIGGQAVLLHGEPRLTQDIDITLAVTPDHLRELLLVCAAANLQPLPEDVEEFTRTTFVLPASSLDTGIRIDFIFSNTSYETQAIARAVDVELSGVAVPFAAVEDLVLHKLFAGRPRDIEDIQGVLMRKGDQVDWNYVEHWASEFAALPGRETMLEDVRRLERNQRGL